MKALVFGALTHIGFHVANELVAAGHEVSATDFADAATYERAPNFGPAVDFVPMDPLLEDAGSVELGVVPSEFDVVFFCASEGYGELAPIPPTEGDLKREGALLGRIVVEGVRALVLTSSSAVYEVPGIDTLIAEVGPLSPSTRLGEHCLALERQLAGGVQRFGIRATTLRCAVVVGTGSGLGTVRKRRASKLGQLVPGLEPTRIHFPNVTFGLTAESAAAAGPHLRDFVHVADVARAHLVVGEALSDHRALAAHYNVGSGRALGTVPALAMLASVDGKEKLEIEATPESALPPSGGGQRSTALSSRPTQGGPRTSSSTKGLRTARRITRGPLCWRRPGSARRSASVTSSWRAG